jgi:hypothetical protein
MSQSTIRKFTTNSRLISELLTKYKTTFYALTELINNSIQAQATRIEITIDYSKPEKVSSSPINSIKIKDNGMGVPLSEFQNRILEIATTAKKDGHGIGRFGALQIGSKVEIETVAWDKEINKFTRVILPIDTTKFEYKEIRDLELHVKEEKLNKQLKSYYSVSITDLYHGQSNKVARKNCVSKELLADNIKLSLFEKYPYEIFNDTVKFIVNGHQLKREEFIYDNPVIKREPYINCFGKENTISFYFYNVKLNKPEVKVFLQIKNGEIRSVAHEFLYSSDYHSRDLGSWYIYLESDFFNSDLFRNIDFDELGHEEIKSLKAFIKDKINLFFLSKSKRFESFHSKLIKDQFNPYAKVQPTSETQEFLFNQLAFLVEDQFKLLEKDNKIRGLVYSLLAKSLNDGQIEGIFEKILELDQKSIQKFSNLLEKTELENVLHFSSEVANKLEFLDFLHEITYGDISLHLRERTQLHKIVENELWIFGESYNGCPKLWSDKKIGNILEQIRVEHFAYEPSMTDDNIIEYGDKGINDITDLFFLNEKLTDSDIKEYMVVELKAPRCAIGQKEINQIDKYAFTIEKNDGLPADKVRYKLILISSRLNDYAKSKMESAFEKYRVPFLYEVKSKKNIEIYIMSWSELIEKNRRKLGYLSKHLQIKDKSVKEKFEVEYVHLINEKTRTYLKRVS